MKNYSQHDEQRFIQKFFKAKCGKFLDIGAYDGITISNTYQLWLNGWHGTYVEPSARSFRKLQKNIDTRFSFIHAAISDDRKLSLFYDCKEDTVASKTKLPIFGVSTLNPDQAERWENGHFAENIGAANFSKYFVPCITWQDLIGCVGTDFDFISIDVEECNQKLLSTMPLKKFKKLKLICIEKEEYLDTTILTDHGFKLAHETLSNFLFARKQKEESKKMPKKELEKNHFKLL